MFVFIEKHCLFDKKNISILDFSKFCLFLQKYLKFQNELFLMCFFLFKKLQKLIFFEKKQKNDNFDM